MRDMSEMQTIEAMLVNVGSAIQPVIHVLNERRPRFVCFFFSEETRRFFPDILQKLDYQPEHHYWITPPDAQNLMGCFRAIRDQLPQILKNWGVSAENLAVEYTAGTKPTSPAAVQASSAPAALLAKQAAPPIGLNWQAGKTDKSGRNVAPPNAPEQAEAFKQDHVLPKSYTPGGRAVVDFAIETLPDGSKRVWVKKKYHPLG